MPEVYVREKDKQDAKIRQLEKQIIALQNDNSVLRQRVGVLEQITRPKEKTEQRTKPKEKKLAGSV
ncbi:MAG: hypothetical protein M0Q91_07630 [Methanoregula sp.]|jgi:TolA-binding protein|nr:hypothetical protein [Methanoregula sp.]